MEDWHRKYLAVVRQLKQLQSVHRQCKADKLNNAIRELTLLRDDETLNLGTMGYLRLNERIAELEARRKKNRAIQRRNNHKHPGGTGGFHSPGAPQRQAGL